MYKVSIIIPTYNCAHTIERTLNSIVAQTHKNLQILVIDDGSTDDTLQIIKQIADNRIELHTIAHRGISHARNTGLQYVTGDFILFIDGDDTIAHHYVTDILALHDEHGKDMVVTGYLRPLYNFNPDAYKNQEEKEEKEAFDIVPFREVKVSQSILTQKSDVYRLLNFDLFAPIFNKLYKKTIIEEFNIRFDNTIGNFFEDELFNLHYFSHISSIAIIDACYYYADINKQPKPEIFGYNPNGLLGITKLIREYDAFLTTAFMQNTDCTLLIKNLLVRKIKMVVNNILIMPDSTIPQKIQYIEDILNNPEFMELVQSCG
ncbi:MAG: glycosyltransferase family 2 protein, partial [Oscillospiraceae bacterium]